MSLATAKSAGREGVAPSSARVHLNRHAQSTPKSLEDCFNLMVGVFAAQIVYVQGHLSVIDEALKKLEEQLRIEIANTTPRKGYVELESGTPLKSTTTRDNASSSGT